MLKKCLCWLSFLNIAAIVLCALPGSLNAQSMSTPIGIFEGQTDVGTVNPAGTLTYDSATGVYTMHAAGANIWHLRDDFYFAWKKLSGDVSLTADINFPITTGKHEEHRKAALMIRKDLSFDDAYVDVAQHGSGITALQFRRQKGDASQSIELNINPPKRVRIEKRGDNFTMFVSYTGEPLHQVGASIKFPMDGPFYLGLGLSAHNADITEEATFSNVELKQLPPVATEPKLPLYSNLQVVSSSLDRSVVVLSQLGNLQAPNLTKENNSLIYNQDGRIYKISANGGTPTPIDVGNVTNCTGSHGISPEGSLLAITCSMPGSAQRHVYIVPIGGGNPRLLTKDEGGNFHSWSPDGKTILLTRTKGTTANIYSISVDGGAETALTSGSGVNDDPDYSPDGMYIYFNTDRWGGMQIGRMHPDGSQPEQVTFDEFKNWTPHPSPDGKWICYLSYGKDVTGHPANKEVRLKVISTTGWKLRGELELTGGSGTINVPSWSPDSKRLGFVGYQMFPVEDEGTMQ